MSIGFAFVFPPYSLFFLNVTKLHKDVRGGSRQYGVLFFFFDSDIEMAYTLTLTDGVIIQIPEWIAVQTNLRAKSSVVDCCKRLYPGLIW